MCEDCERPLDREVDFGLTAADFDNADEHDDEILEALASEPEQEPEQEPEPDSTSTEAPESKQCSICGKNVEDCNVHDHRGVLFEDPIDRALGKMRHRKWRKEDPERNNATVVLASALRELAPTKHGPRDGKSVYALRRECAEAGHRPSQLALARHTRTERRITPWRRTIGPFEFGIHMALETEWRMSTPPTFLDERNRERLSRYLSVDPEMVFDQDVEENEYQADYFGEGMLAEDEYWQAVEEYGLCASDPKHKHEGCECYAGEDSDDDMLLPSIGDEIARRMYGIDPPEEPAVYESAAPCVVARVPGEPSIAIFMPEDDEEEPVTCRVVGMDHEGAIVLTPADDEEDRRVGDDPDEHELALFV